MSVLKRKIPEVFAPLLKPARYKGAFGGRGSGKSHFFAELLVEECLAEPGMLAVCIREVQKTLAQSSKRLIEDKIAALGVGPRFRVFADRIETPGDGLIIFQGMLDRAVNNSARQNMADIRAAFDDLIWFQYGIGSKAVAHAYASGTSTTIAGADVTGVYHAGRRVRAVGSSTGTIYGAIASSSYNSGTSITTVTYSWDSGALSNEVLVISLSQAPVTGSPVAANPALTAAWRADIQAQAGNYAVTTGTNSYAISLTPAPASYSSLVGVSLKVQFANGQTTNALTLNVNGLGAKSLVRLGVAGENTMFFADIVAGSIHELVYDGTDFQVIDLNALAVTGSGQARTTAVPNTNTPTTIFGAVAGTCNIYHDFGAGNAFSDIVNFYQGTSVGVAAQGSTGSPGTRSYSMSGSFLQMALSGAPAAAAITPIVLQSSEPSP